MLAYAAHRRRIAERHSSPNVMLLIVIGHIALVAAVMSARMELPVLVRDPPIFIDPIPLPKPPPENPRVPPKQIEDLNPVRPLVPIPRPTNDEIKLPLNPQPFPGGELTIPNPQPPIDPPPLPKPVRTGPRFATPASDVRPPYPASKIASEEEALLRLRLSIDARGRVISVEPVGRADPAFLAAARRHLIAHWRYRPATEDGRAITSATVITLRFELE